MVSLTDQEMVVGKRCTVEQTDRNMEGQMDEWRGLDKDGQVKSQINGCQMCGQDDGQMSRVKMVKKIKAYGWDDGLEDGYMERWLNT